MNPNSHSKCVSRERDISRPVICVLKGPQHINDSWVKEALELCFLIDQRIFH